MLLAAIEKLHNNYTVFDQLHSKLMFVGKGHKYNRAKVRNFSGCYNKMGYKCVCVIYYIEYPNKGYVNRYE